MLPGDRPTRNRRDINRERVSSPPGAGQPDPYRIDQEANAPAANGLRGAQRAIASQARWPRGPLGLLVLVLLVVAFAQTSSGRGLMRLAGLAQTPPAYTALYFSNSQRLPTSLPTGHVEFPVSFVVQNSSSQAKTYQWKVEVQNGKSTVQVGGQLSLSGGSTAVETKSVKAICSAGGGLVIKVSLAGTAESIDYRVVCNA